MQLPGKFENKLAQSVLGGWEVGGILNTRTGLPVDVTISRPDIVWQVNGTNTFVNALSNVPAGQTATAVINNPFGGAFRNNRRPNVVAGVDPYPAYQRRKGVPQSGGLHDSSTRHVQQHGPLRPSWTGPDPA